MSFADMAINSLGEYNSKARELEDEPNIPAANQLRKMMSDKISSELIKLINEAVSNNKNEVIIQNSNYNYSILSTVLRDFKSKGYLIDFINATGKTTISW